MPTTSLIKDVSIATGVDSAKIGAGDVSNAEHAYLNSITSNIQTQVSAAGGDIRNFIIDGDFTQWPTGTAAATTGNNVYTSALWESGQSHAGTTTVERSTDVPTVAASDHQSAYSMLIKCTGTDASIAAGDYSSFKYYITGNDFAHLHEQQVTISFWAKTAANNSGDDYNLFLWNSAGSRTYTQTFSPTSTWTKFTFTISLDTSGTWLFTNADVGLQIGIALVSGTLYDNGTEGSFVGTTEFWASSGTAISNFLASTSNEFYLSQVQIVLGSTAPAFLAEPISTVRNQVEYYVETSYDDGTAPGASSQYDDGQYHTLAGTTNHLPGIQFISRKRVVPTVTLWSGNGAAGKATEFAGSSDNANTGGSSSWVGQSGGGYITYSGGNFTAGSVYGTHYFADARH